MKKFQTITGEYFAGKSNARFLMLFLIAILTLGGFIIIAAKNLNNNDGMLSALTMQSSITGEWTAELSRKKPGEIQMTFQRRSDNNGFNMSSDSILLSELQGLTPESASSVKTNVNFNIVREAGTFACEGFFHEGRGAGFWTFTANSNFVSAMRSRGYNNLSDEDVLRAALHNLTTKYIEDLKSVGYERLEFQQLLRASSHDITLKYIREMKAAGFDSLSMEELIRAQNHDINSEYIKEVKAMGFDKQPLESLIRLRNHDINQEFISQMRTAGFDNLSIEELVRLKNHEITAEYVNDLKAEGYPDIPVETAIRLKNNEIDRNFIQRVKARGLTNISLEQLIRLHSQEIVK